MSAATERDEASHRVWRMHNGHGYTDVSILCGGQTFHLHAAVISRGSAFFSAAFASGMVEELCRSMEIKEMRPQVPGLDRR